VKAQKVAVIVDPEYGERLLALRPEVPVWIVDSPHNVASAQNARQELHGRRYITTFKTASRASAQKALLDVLDVVELHHGSQSASVPYSELQIVGTEISSNVEAALADLGFDELHSTADGFVATRSRQEQNH
jgi:hypothetical protein